MSTRRCTGEMKVTRNANDPQRSFINHMVNQSHSFSGILSIVSLLPKGPERKRFVRAVAGLTYGFIVETNSVPGHRNATLVNFESQNSLTTLCIGVWWRWLCLWNVGLFATKLVTITCRHSDSVKYVPDITSVIIPCGQRSHEKCTRSMLETKTWLATETMRLTVGMLRMWHHYNLHCDPCRGLQRYAVPRYCMILIIRSARHDFRSYTILSTNIHFKIEWPWIFFE